MSPLVGHGIDAVVCDSSEFPYVIYRTLDGVSPCPTNTAPPTNLCMIAGYFEFPTFGINLGFHVFEGVDFGPPTGVRIRLDTGTIGQVFIPSRHQSIWVRAEVTPTLMQVKVWYQDTPEPASWTTSKAISNPIFGQSGSMNPNYTSGHPAYVAAVSAGAASSDSANSPDGSHSWDVVHRPAVADFIWPPGSQGDSHSISNSFDTRTHNLQWSWPNPQCEDCAGTNAEIILSELVYQGFAAVPGAGHAHVSGTIQQNGYSFNTIAPAEATPIPWEIRLCTYNGEIPPAVPAYTVIASGVFTNPHFCPPTAWSADIAIPVGHQWHLVGVMDESMVTSFIQPHQTVTSGRMIGLQLITNWSALLVWTAADIAAMAGACADTSNLISRIIAAVAPQGTIF